MLKVVVFPAPLGPSKPTISPAPTLMETPLTTRRCRYSLTSFSVDNSFSSVPGEACARGLTVSINGLICVSSIMVAPVCTALPSFQEFVFRQLQLVCFEPRHSSINAIFSPGTHESTLHIKDDGGISKPGFRISCFEHRRFAYECQQFIRPSTLASISINGPVRHAMDRLSAVASHRKNHVRLGGHASGSLAALVRINRHLLAGHVHLRMSEADLAMKEGFFRIQRVLTAEDFSRVSVGGFGS